MTAIPKITVYGATGMQGASTMKSLLQNVSHPFQVQGTTRNTQSPAAKELTAMGGQMIQLEGLDHNALVDIFKGNWGVFLNTNALLATKDLEEHQVGKIIVDAAVEAGVPNIVYSGLVSMSALTNGRLKAYDFDQKSAVSEYIKTKGFQNAVIVSPGFYLESLLGQPFDVKQFGGFPWIKDEQDVYTMKYPSWPGGIPAIDMAGDFGDIVHGVFLDPAQYNCQFIQAFSETIAPSDLVEQFQKITGKQSRYIPLDWTTIETYDDESMRTIKAMFGFAQTTNGGGYYDKTANNSLAARLKASAAAARGLSGADTKLSSAAAYIRKNFALV